MLTEKLEEIDNLDSREEVLNYLTNRRANGVKLNTLKGQLRTLRDLANSKPDTPVSEFTKQDLVRVIAKWADEYADSTATKRKVHIKLFYKEAHKDEIGEVEYRKRYGDKGYPERVSWINTTNRDLNRKDPSQLITSEEVKRMVKNCNNSRDKAIISTLYESGMRRGEIWSLDIGDVELDPKGAIVRLNPDEGGLKTGTRTVRLINSSPYLENWIRDHPDGDNPSSPLWVSLAYNANGEKLSKAAINRLINRAAKRADIKKNVYPHLFRHSRATELAKLGFTETDMKIMLGWTRTSEMPARYIHMSGADVEEKILRFHGLLDDEEEQEPDPLEPWVCPRQSCGHKNPADARFCGRCTLARSAKDAEELEEAQETTAKDFIKMMKENPELIEKYNEFTEALEAAKG